MKIALVTGANRGLGFETSKQLAIKGFKVYMGCRDEKKGLMAVQKLSNEKLNVEFIKLDVTKTADIRNIHDLLKKKNEKIDVLINNAGVFLESDGPTDDVDASVFKVDPVIILKTIEANTMGPLNLIQAIVPFMLEAGEGRVINVSSGMGALSDMGGCWPGYRISKTALNALTKIVAAEVSNTNITVNSICPGWVKTDMGGESATRSIIDGVETAVWLATCDNPPQGKFLRDCKEIDW